MPWVLNTQLSSSLHRRRKRQLVYRLQYLCTTLTTTIIKLSRRTRDIRATEYQYIPQKSSMQSNSESELSQQIIHAMQYSAHRESRENPSCVYCCCSTERCKLLQYTNTFRPFVDDVRLGDERLASHISIHMAVRSSVLIQEPPPSPVVYMYTVQHIATHCR